MHTVCLVCSLTRVYKVLDFVSIFHKRLSACDIKNLPFVNNAVWCKVLNCLPVLDSKNQLDTVSELQHMLFEVVSAVVCMIPLHLTTRNMFYTIKSILVSFSFPCLYFGIKEIIQFCLFYPAIRKNIYVPYLNWFPKL